MTTRTDVLQIRFTADGDGRVRAQLDRLDDSLVRVDKGSRQAAGGMAGLTRGANLLRGALGGLALGVVARQLVQITDTMKEMRSRLRIVTDGEKELNTVLEDTLRLANETRTSLQPTITLYSRLARATNELDVSQQDLLQVTKTINQAFQVSGATAQEARNAVIQLSQGLASGQLRGEEYRSVMEQGDRIVVALADSLGKTRGELMEMAFAGKLTSEIVIGALKDQAATIDREFGQVEVTISSAMTVLNNNLSVFVDNLDEGAGASASLVTSIELLTGALSFLNDEIAENNSLLENAATAADRAAGWYERLKAFADLATFGLTDQAGAANDLIRILMQLGQSAEHAGPQINDLHPPLKKVGDQARETRVDFLALNRAFSPDSARETAIAQNNLADELNNTKDAVKGAGDAAKQSSVDFSLLNLSINSVTQTGREAAIAQNELADSVNRTREAQAEATTAFNDAHTQYIKILRARIAGGEEAAEVERRLQQAQDDQIDTTREQIAAQVAAERQLEQYVDASEEAAERWRSIWTGAISDVSTGLGEAFTDELIREEQAKDRAKRQLEERLEDLQEQLDEGTISHEDALEKRKELYADYADRIDEIDRSIWERMEDVMVDSFASALEKMISEWFESGITELVSSLFDDQDGISFGGFSLDKVFGQGGDDGGDGTGTSVVTAGAKELYNKFFGGPTSTSGAGQAGVSTAPAVGTATGAGVTTLGGANTISGLGGGISGASVTGGQAGAGLGGGTAGAGGMAALGYAAAVLAIPFIGQALAGKTNREQFLNDFAGFNEGTAGGFAAGTGKKGKHGFFAGPNAGFAADFIGQQAGAGATFSANREGTFGFTQGFQGEELLEVLERAEAKFQELLVAGPEAFSAAGLAAQETAQIIRDGLVDGTEAARLGIENIGEAYRHPKTGAIELKEITATQFAEITAAINSGELRLEALQDTTLLTARELEVLGEMGLDAMVKTADGARELAQAIHDIPSDKTITIHEQRVSSAIERRHGGGGAPNPERGLAEGGVVTRRGLYELAEFNHPELVVPLSGGRSVPVEVRGGGPGGGMDQETKSLLRSIDARLARLDDLSTRIDGRSIAEMREAIGEPFAEAQRSEARRRDRRGRRR